MKHFPNPQPVTYDTPHSVTLSVSDWLGLQTQMGFAAQMNVERGEHATAEVTRGLLDRLRPQTMTAIEAAALNDEAAT